MNKSRPGKAVTDNLPVIREQEPSTWQQFVQTQSGERNMRFFKMGKAHIIVSPPQSDKVGWHLSISHPDRYPGWDEIAKARYELIPDHVVMVMYLPPRAEYVAIHDHCFHLWEEGKRSIR